MFYSVLFWSPPFFLIPVMTLSMDSESKKGRRIIGRPRDGGYPTNTPQGIIDNVWRYFGLSHLGMGLLLAPLTLFTKIIKKAKDEMSRYNTI